MDKIKIYTLSHPISNEIRYIGKTKYSLEERLSKHLASNGKNHRTNWIRSVLNLGLKPKIELLDECIEENWQNCEKYWISQFKEWGFDLVNSTEGGESGVISSQCRQASIDVRKLTKQSEELIERRIKNLRKEVQQFSKNGILLNEYISASEASRLTNCQLSHITECCNNKSKRKTSKGFIWKYKIKI